MSKKHPSLEGFFTDGNISGFVLYSDFSKALLLHPGVVRIELLTDDLEKKIGEIEHSPSNIGFAPIDPVGFGEICRYDLKLIIFCSSEFDMFTDCFMDMVDSRGQLIGHDIMDSEKYLYQSKQYVWLTDNLFVDMTLMTEYQIKSIIRSIPLKIEGLEEDVQPRVYYPCASSANYLNEKFGAMGKISITALVGVNNVEF